MAGFRKAERRKAKLRLGLVGPAGSGKTYGALLIAMGLGGKIALIDTENGSGDLYAHLGDYDVCTLDAPYTVQKYLTAIEEAEQAGYSVLIIDSLSHAWAGEGGLLDQQGKIADSGRGNSYTAWRQVTPWHNKLVEAMLTSKCHIIATMRAKTEYVQEKNDKGKTEIRKVGMAPVQRDGMDYEFGVVFDLDVNHNATVSKDRTTLFDGQIFRPSRKTGEALRDWLESGTDSPVPAGQPTSTPNTPANPSRTAQDGATPQERGSHTPTPAERKKALYDGYLAVCDGVPQHAQNAMLQITEGRPSKEWTETDLKRLAVDLYRRQGGMTDPAPVRSPVEPPEPEGAAEEYIAELEKEGPVLPFGEALRDVMPDIDQVAKVEL